MLKQESETKKLSRSKKTQFAGRKRSRARERPRREKGGCVSEKAKLKNEQGGPIQK